MAPFRPLKQTDAYALGCLIAAIFVMPATGASVSGANLNSPESPATNLIGGSTQDITHPGSPAAVGMSLLNGFDVQGHYQTGLGLDFVPALLVNAAAGSDWISTESYKADRFIRFLARTSLSAATAKAASSSDDAVAVGVGLRTILFDAGDPVRDDLFIACLAAAQSDGSKLESQIAAGQIPMPGKPLPGSAEGLALQRTEETRCRKNFGEQEWNRSAWDIAIARAFISADGSYNHLGQPSYAVYSTFGYGFDGLQALTPDYLKSHWLARNAEILVGLKYIHAQQTEDKAAKGTFFKQESFQIGTALRLKHLFGSESEIVDAASAHLEAEDDRSFSFANTLLSFSVVYKSNHAPMQPHTNDVALTLGIELKISDATYLDLGIGEERKSKDGSHDGFALTQLKYNISDSSSLF